MNKSSIKILLITLSLLVDHAAVVDRVQSLGMSFSLAVYAILFLALVLSLFSAALIGNNLLRWTLASVFAAAAFFVDGYQFISNEAMTYDIFISLVGLTGDAQDALHQHFYILILILIKSLTLFFAIGLKPSPVRFLPQKISVSMPIFLLVALPVMLFVRGGDGTRGLPGAWTGSGFLALHLYETGLAAGENQPRKDVEIAHQPAGVTHDIVLIVDESIAGHYLDINSPNGVRSGLGAPPDGVAVRNFGLAASIAVCSASSNFTLRYGGSREAYQKINATMPSIWRYAKKAGLGTLYIDAQRIGRQFINGMDEAELKHIDRWVQFDTVPVLDRDHAVADVLAEALNDGIPQFIFVNKMGAHFPVADKYPDAYFRYQPALARSSDVNIGEMSAREWLEKNQVNWQLYRNSYRNTLLWNVGDFFDRFFAKARIGDATIIYTSDHGQDLHEREKSGANTHCSADPPPAEAVVPLLVIEGAANTRHNWEKSLAANYNHSSHYRIFPTLLKFMGYDAQRVHEVYGEDLLSLTPDPYTFNARFNARLGQKPVWKRIEPDRLAMPPLSDYQAVSNVR